jgi:hypothetical protein
MLVHSFKAHRFQALSQFSIAHIRRASSAGEQRDNNTSAVLRATLRLPGQSVEPQHRDNLLFPPVLGCPPAATRSAIASATAPARNAIGVDEVAAARFDGRTPRNTKASPLRGANRGSWTGRVRESGLRRLPPCRAADARGTAEGRAEPRGEGSRPQRTAPVPRVREEGAGGGLDQVAGSGQVSRRYVRQPYRHRSARAGLLIFGNRPKRSFGRVAGTNLNSRALAAL